MRTSPARNLTPSMPPASRLCIRAVGLPFFWWSWSLRSWSSRSSASPACPGWCSRVSWESPSWRVLAYEIIKYAGRHKRGFIARVVLWPGLSLQRLTTRQPGSDQIEVAIAALQEVLRVDAGGEPAPTGLGRPRKRLQWTEASHDREAGGRDPREVAALSPRSCPIRPSSTTRDATRRSPKRTPTLRTATDSRRSTSRRSGPCGMPRSCSRRAAWSPR